MGRRHARARPRAAPFALFAAKRNAGVSFCRSRLEIAPLPLPLSVHRTLTRLQPQDEIAPDAKNVAQYVRRLRFVAVDNWGCTGFRASERWNPALCPLSDCFAPRAVGEKRIVAVMRRDLTARLRCAVGRREVRVSDHGLDDCRRV